MNARELNEQIRYWRNVANGGRGSTMTEALHGACDHLESYASLLASVEGSGEEVVRAYPLSEHFFADPRRKWCYHDEAMARIVALEAELAGVKAHAEAMAVEMSREIDAQDKDRFANSFWLALVAYRAAHPETPVRKPLAQPDISNDPPCPY